MSIDYASVLADLEERRDKLNAAIDAIREIMGAPAPGTSTRSKAQTQSRAAKKPRTGTVATIAYEYIRNHGGPMKVADVVKMLSAVGKFKSPDARSNYGTVYGTLNADDRFVRVGEGQFEIRERVKQPSLQGGVDRELSVIGGTARSG